MATAPIVDATDSRSTEQHVVTLQFQRLARPSPTRATSPPPLAERRDDAAVVPARDEPSNAEAADPASAIDWLLNRSRTNGR